jgi:flavin reductase (DIM6/NTAB) family NADH-FMN oxidoreductase RutF
MRVHLPHNKDRELRAGYLRAMSRMTAAVSVLTTNGVAGRFGQTVSAVTSVCADPPTLLACLYADTPVAEAVRVNRCFAVNVLSERHVDIAESFAGRTAVESRYRFDDEWRARRTGSPVRTDLPAVFDCELADFAEAGTHIVLFGRVIGVGSLELPDLTYRDRRYQAVTPNRSTV